MKIKAMVQAQVIFTLSLTANMKKSCFSMFHMSYENIGSSSSQPLLVVGKNRSRVKRCLVSIPKMTPPWPCRSSANGESISGSLRNIGENWTWHLQGQWSCLFVYLLAWLSLFHTSPLFVFVCFLWVTWIGHDVTSLLLFVGRFKANVSI